MGNSAFNQTGITEPLVVSKGGTGLTTIASGKYMIGAGTSTPTLKTAAEVLADVVVANSIDYVKQGAEFKDDLTINTNAIDWATGFYKEITLTANTTFTFSNLEKGKVIHLKMTGAYVPTFPSGCIIINGGTYTGAKQNNIYIECVNSTTPQFKISIQVEP